MNEISSLAETEIRKRYDQLSEKDIKKRAEMIALGAIKFFMLKTDASRDIIFNPEESLSFEGETGPYLQYTHARSCSILRKAEKNNVVNDFSLLSTNSELAILKLLNQFPEKIKESAANYKPHLICRYLLDLAQAYNEFYHQSQVISEDKELMNARLHLVDSVRQVLHNGLDLLGIKSPEEM